jgi:predicted dienelactone hydrolase
MRSGLTLRIGRALIGLGLLLSLQGCATVWAGLGPQGPAPESLSAARLAAGPYDVATRNLTFVDETRATNANGRFTGAPSRTFATTLWYPKNAAGPLPLVVYSHGFMSYRSEAGYLLRHLASHGFVVASADYPLTNRRAPGDPTLTDIVHQPTDVSFLIDSVLALEGDDRPFPGPIDRDRIGVVGLSLGGLTSTLVAFHPRLRDSRVRTAISIAGPSSFLSRRFFETAPVPFLMIAGTDDAIVPYHDNGRPILDRAPTGALVTIAGASHVGFAGIAGTLPFLRFSHNPDGFGCRYLEGHLDLDAEEEESALAALGGADEGIHLSPDLVQPCEDDELRRSMRPPRQHIITTLAVRAFLESVLASGSEAREAAADYLANALAAELREASFAASAR